MKSPLNDVHLNMCLKNVYFQRFIYIFIPVTFQQYAPPCYLVWNENIITT